MYCTPFCSQIFLHNCSNISTIVTVLLPLGNPVCKGTSILLYDSQSLSSVKTIVTEDTNYGTNNWDSKIVRVDNIWNWKNFVEQHGKLQHNISDKIMGKWRELKLAHSWGQLQLIWRLTFGDKIYSWQWKNASEKLDRELQQRHIDSPIREWTNGKVLRHVNTENLSGKVGPINTAIKHLLDTCLGNFSTVKMRNITRQLLIGKWY